MKQQYQRAKSIRLDRFYIGQSIIYSQERGSLLDGGTILRLGNKRILIRYIDQNHDEHQVWVKPKNLTAQQQEEVCAECARSFYGGDMFWCHQCERFTCSDCLIGTDVHKVDPATYVCLFCAGDGIQIAVSLDKEKNVFLVARDGLYLYCPDCHDLLSSCITCLSWGHFKTVGWRTLGHTFSICEACQPVLMEIDQDTRGWIFNAILKYSAPAPFSAAWFRGQHKQAA